MPPLHHHFLSTLASRSHARCAMSDLGVRAGPVGFEPTSSASKAKRMSVLPHGPCEVIGGAYNSLFRTEKCASGHSVAPQLSHFLAAWAFSEPQYLHLIFAETSSRRFSTLWA